MWSMPDPRNLQLANRGILEALFNDEFREAFTTAVGPMIDRGLHKRSITLSATVAGRTWTTPG